MYADLRRVAEQAEVLLTELTQLAQNGPRLRITHRFHVAGTLCLPGEEIWAISLICRERETPLPLSLALRQVVNYLAECKSDSSRNATVSVLRETRDELWCPLKAQNQPFRDQRIRQKDSPSTRTCLQGSRSFPGPKPSSDFQDNDGQ
jgi:hypothetical protein